MEVLNLKNGDRVPENFTGIIDWDDGDLCWYLNRRLHRDNGPAIICRHNSEDVEWYLHGEYYNSKGDWFNALTDNQKEDALWSEDFWG